MSEDNEGVNPNTADVSTNGSEGSPQAPPVIDIARLRRELFMIRLG